MPKLNLIGPQMFGADAAESNQGIRLLLNGYVENLSGDPAIKTRPGLVQTNNFEQPNTRVDLYWWEAGRTLIAVCAGSVYVLESENGDWTNVTPGSTDDRVLSYNGIVMFASDENGVHMSTGQGVLWWTNGLSSAVRVVSSSLPRQITGLTYLKGYFIASELNTQNFYYATYGPTDSRDTYPPWSSQFLTASTSPDDIVTLQAGWEELFILGRESAESQFVTGDSTIPFRSLSGSAIETGLINRGALQKMLDTWVYANPNKQIILMQGRTPKVISKPIEASLYQLSNYQDVSCFRLYNRFFVLNFYTDHKTFIFDFETQLWYRWETWDNINKRYRRFLGISAAFAQPWGQQFVGGFDGKVYRMDKSVVLDGSLFIRVLIQTGVLDHGILDKKKCRELQFRLKRGEG